MRVILDTSVIVSAFLSPHGAPAQVLEHWLHGHFVLLYTPAMLLELEDVLHRAWLRDRLHGVPNKVPDFLEAVRILGEIVVGYVDVSGNVRDPFDEMFLMCAVLGKADFLASVDKDLLSLGRYRETQIVTPAQLLSAI